MRSFLLKAFLPLALLLFFILPRGAFAASLSLSPATGSFSVGKTFSVNVSASSPAEALNAVSGVVNFPTDLLHVVSVSKSPSILTLWVEDPSYSNSAGSISFEGVVPNPGYVGISGNILTITFKVLKSGAALVKFGAGSILANDGSGTNILDTLNPATYSLVEVSEPAPVVEPIKEPLPETTPTPNTPLSVTHVVPPVTVYIVEPPILSISLLALLLILLLLSIFLYIYRRRKYAKPKTDLEAVEKMLETSFVKLKKDVHIGVKLLEDADAHRPLTREEALIVERLRKHLSATERDIHDEMMRAEEEMRK